MAARPPEIVRSPDLADRTAGGGGAVSSAGASAPCAGDLRQRRPKTSRGGSGESTAVASVTTAAPAAQRARSAPATTRAGTGSPAQRRARRRWAAAPAAATSTRLPNRRPRQTAGSATAATCREHEAARRHLPAGEREPRPVSHVGGQAAAGSQHPGHLGVQLDRGEVRRRPRAGEDVQHHQVGGLRPAAGPAPRGRRRPARAPSRRGQRQRSCAPRRPPRPHLDRPLARTWPRSADVPGEGQCAGPEVHDPQRRARLGGEVDDVAEPAHVLEREVRRVGQVDVRLRRAVDGEQPARRAVAVGLRPTTATASPWSTGRR